MGYIAFKTDNLVVGKTYTLYVNNAPTRYGLYSPDGNTPLVSYTTNKLNTFTYTTSYNSVTMHINDGGTTVISQDMIDNMIIYLVEGDYTRYDFSDYDPTKVGKYRVDYKATGKNKFHGKSLLSDYTINNDGIIQHISNEDSRAWHYNNSQYFVPLPSGSYTISIYVVNPSSDINNACTIRLPNNSRVVSWGNSVFASVSKYSTGFTLNTSTVLGIQLKLFGGATCKIQIEEGSTDTEYKPYKEGNKVLYLNSPLLEGDTIEQYGNNIAHVHRYGKTVLDGSENWRASSLNNRYPGQYLCYLDYSNVSYVHDTEMSPMMCDKFKVVSPENTNSSISPDSISVSGIESNLSAQAFCLSISESKLSSLDLAGFRKYLLANPITVVYKLASPTYEVISTNDELLIDSYVNGHLDFESAVLVEKVDFRGTGKTLKYLQSLTPYIIQFDADANGFLDYIVLGDEATKTNIQVTKGINKINLTTTSSTVPFLYFNGIGFNASNIVVTPAIEQDFDYFSGLSSTFESELITDESSEHYGKYRVDYKVTGKNKFPNKSDMWETGIFNEISGSLSPTTVCKAYTDFIPVICGTTYTLSNSNSSINFRVFYYGEHKDASYLGNSLINTSMSTISFTTPKNCKYIRFHAATMSLTGLNIQIEEGSTSTAYEPYKEYTKTLYLNSPLLEGDTIEEINGGIYHVHRSGEVVFDGSGDEEWVQSPSNDSTKPNYFIWADDMFYKYTNTNQLCDKMKISNPYGDYSQNIVKIINGSARIRKDDYLEVGISSWLQSNPITLVAQLEEPTYELIEQSNLAIPSYANGHLDFDTAVPVEKVDFLPFSEELTYLYPSTSYTVQFISDKAITADITLGGTQLLAQSIVTGLNKITITTTTRELLGNKLVISGAGANISEVVVTNTDREFGYFEGMKSVGECEELAITSANSDNTLSNAQQLTHEPLRGTRDAKDRYVLIDGKWYIERKCGIRAYQEGDEDNYKTDLVNTVYPLEMPIYEPLEYNPFEVYSSTTHITTNSVIPTNIIVKNHGFNCLLKPSTTYTISSNLGLNTVTTPESLTEDCLRFMDTDTSNITTMRDVLVLEGDWTTKADLIPANFSGIESCFEQEYDAEKGKYKVNVKVANEDKSKESNITFYINEPLRGVENNKDKVFIQDDKVIVQRNCGGTTFDGSNDEGWAVSGNPPMSNSLSEFTKKFSECKVLTNLISNNFSMQQENAEGFKNTSAVYNLRLFINKVKLQTQDLEGFKQWLQTNPITVVYQLAEPTYEEVEYSSNRLILNTFNNESFNNSTLFLDTNISPKLSFKPLYEELVYVKNSTKYYIQFNAVGSGEVVINLGGTELTTEIVEGYNCIPITTPSESTNLMTIIGQGITISEVVVSEVVCGGYYKGLQSCFEEHMENGKYRVLLRGIALDGSKVNGIKLYINEPLRGIGDAKDRLCIKNGKLMVERKCGEIVLDEKTTWSALDSATLPNNPRRYTPDFKDINAKFTGNHCSIITDRWETINNDTDVPHARLSFSSALGYGILWIYDPIVRDATKLQQYLQQNPVKVVYQLAEPTYEEAINEYGLPIVFEGYENGIVYIDSAVTPTTHIKYTSNNQLATTLAEAEEQNIATQEDINMNVITYMMDIDMILTDMEMSNDISVMAVRRNSSNENMLDRMSEEDKKVYRDNTVVMLEKMITANVLEKEDIEGRIDMYYNKNRISKEQYKYLKSLL